MVNTDIPSGAPEPFEIEDGQPFLQERQNSTNHNIAGAAGLFLTGISAGIMLTTEKEDVNLSQNAALAITGVALMALGAGGAMLNRAQRSHDESQREQNWSGRISDSGSLSSNTSRSV